MTGKNKDGSIRVLIISHPGMMQNVLRETFSRRTDVVVVGVASGGLTAIEMVKREHLDMVVIDSNLPESEVRELISWIKKFHKHIHILVLVETTKQLRRTSYAGADFALHSYSLTDCLDAVLAKLSASQYNQVTDR